jgi:hypothetical protein
MSDYYVSPVKCRNCKTINPIKIQKGVEVEDFLDEDNTKCWCCDCRLAKDKKEEEKS